MKDDITLADIGRDLRRYGKVLFGFVALIWVLELLSWVIPIDALGVRPRETVGLIGVLTHPFLHVGLGHVLSNSVAILLFGGLVVLKEERDLYVTALLAALVGGLGTWLIGRSGTNHIGASGVAFGLFGYLLTTGWFERKLGSIVLSVGVLLVWGSLLLGMSPLQTFVSWEGHLTGFAGGVLSAYLLARWHRSAAPTR
ncbi:MAG: rhomboid family intramembrane serine protease [Sandaracinaceae bacterium]|nr:MAG: rhomboid family intramembrane serine protease [Sandaracinaceae bacterium]HBQ10038.1 rhomboid family intramembrane serine protease [Myxococcales bacterium]